MELTPITRKENFLAKAAGDPNALDLDPITREEWFISQIQGGGGGSVTPEAVLSAMEGMDSSQQSAARAAIGATDASTSIPDNVKAALLNCFDHVAWTDDQGQTYVDALEAALYPLDHITAVYTQSGTVYDTDSLDSLKSDLVVTAVYEGGNTETVAAANYTLSGTLTVGTSTITVTYSGKTTTFEVTVTEKTIAIGYEPIGNPTVADNLLTIEDGKYFRTTEKLSPEAGQAWNVRMKYKYTALSNTFLNLLSGANADGTFAKTLVVQENSTHQYICYVSADKSTWAVSNMYNDAMTLSTGTWYYLEFGYDGTYYYESIKTGGFDGTSIGYRKLSSNATIYGGEYIGFGTKSNVSGINAQVDLTGCSFTVGGELVWKAV